VVYVLLKAPPFGIHEGPGGNFENVVALQPTLTLFASVLYHIPIYPKFFASEEPSLPIKPRDGLGIQFPHVCMLEGRFAILATLVLAMLILSRTHATDILLMFA
jgi:hypothetical protein